MAAVSSTFYRRNCYTASGSASSRQSLLKPTCRLPVFTRSGIHIGQLQQQQRSVQQLAPAPGLGKPPSVNSSAAQGGGGSFVAQALVGLLAVVGASFVAFSHLRKTKWFKNLGVSGGFKDDFLYKEAMKDMNSETLSKDIIMAARNRRNKDGLSTNVMISDLELPQNHPWATNKPVSKDEADAQVQRLHIRSTRRRMQQPVEGQ